MPLPIGNSEFLERLKEAFATSKKNEKGTIFINMKRLLTVKSSNTSKKSSRDYTPKNSDNAQDGNEMNDNAMEIDSPQPNVQSSHSEPQQYHKTLIRLNNGKKTLATTLVSNEGMDEFMETYVAICRKEMDALKKKDRVKKIKKKNKKSSTTNVVSAA